MACRIAHSRLARRGNAVLEAAFVFPVLLAFVFGSVEFGMYFYTKHALQVASREGARTAIISGASSNQITSAVEASMTASGYSRATNPSLYTIEYLNAAGTAAIDPANATAGTGLMVRVSANWGTVGVRPMGLIGTGKTVVGQTVMRKE
jgi:Flp pilus assembly protein TadG